MKGLLLLQGLDDAETTRGLLSADRLSGKVRNLNDMISSDDRLGTGLGGHGEYFDGESNSIKVLFM